MSVAFQTIAKGSDLQSSKFRSDFGFMVDPDQNGTGTKVRVYGGYDDRVRTPLVSQKDFTIADQDFVYLHEDYIATIE